jgi:membrane protease YdiL (CAAX protease family)
MPDDEFEPKHDNPVESPVPSPGDIQAEHQAEHQAEQQAEVSDEQSSSPVEPHSITPSTDAISEALADAAFTNEQAKPLGIAPVWHTVLLVVAILVYSLWGAIGAKNGTTNPIAPPSGSTRTAVTNGVDHIRLIRYALTGLLELGVVAWIALGLRLRKIPFRTLFGALPKGLNNITMEFFVAAGFWLCSMVVLIVFALGWLAVQTQVYKYETAKQAATSSQSNPSAHGRPRSEEAKPKSPEQQQADMARQLMELAPANGIEIASWAVLCILVGFSEELIFRGYMQSQGIAFLRNVPISIILTALVFGLAHGYQGVRGVCLISIYGALFGIITLIRKNLLPGIVAHSWHDFATGLALALIRSSHLLEHLPMPKK